MLRYTFDELCAKENVRQGEEQFDAKKGIIVRRAAFFLDIEIEKVKAEIHKEALGLVVYLVDEEDDYVARTSHIYAGRFGS